MALISSGIYRVRAYALPAGVFANGDCVYEPLSVLVGWRCELEGKLYQVYVDGRLAGVTGDLQQREIAISLNSSWQRVVCIEVYAVEPGEANVDHSDEIESAFGGGRVELSWIRGMSLPHDGVVEVFGDGGSGEVALDESLGEIDIWGVWQDKGGFGLSSFGKSDFGFDGSAAVGFGRGVFGGGEFGFDADGMEWVSEELNAGEYLFGLSVVDGKCGSEVGYCQTDPVVVVPLPKGDLGLEGQSYDEANNSMFFVIG